MSKFYNPKRVRNLFEPSSKVPYKLSRSKLELFLNCPRCFYLDRRLGTGQPQGPAFSLNVAVDKLLKKEFDTHRAKGESHPLMKTYGIDKYEAFCWCCDGKGTPYARSYTTSEGCELLSAAGFEVVDFTHWLDDMFCTYKAIKQ